MKTPGEQGLLSLCFSGDLQELEQYLLHGNCPVSEQPSQSISNRVANVKGQWTKERRTSLLLTGKRICLPVQETQAQSLNREDPLEQEKINPLQYSSLANPKSRGAWRATGKQYSTQNGKESQMP